MPAFVLTSFAILVMAYVLGMAALVRASWGAWREVRTQSRTPAEINRCSLASSSATALAAHSESVVMSMDSILLVHG